MIFKTENKKHLPYLIFIGVVLFFGFSSAIFNVYLYHDDLFFWDTPSSLKVFPPNCKMALFIGRYIAAYILWSYFFVVTTVSDLNKIRLVSSLFIACCAIGSYGILFKYLKRPIDAALSAIMLFSIPAFQIWSSHVGESYEVYTLIFVIPAVYTVDKIPTQGQVWKRILGKAGLISVFLLICASMVYPSLATIYWPLAAVLVLAQMDEGKGLRAKIENIFIPGITATLLYACIYKFRNYFFKFFLTSSYNPDTFASNASDKFLWFFQTVIPQSLNLWNIFPDDTLTLFLTLFLCGAVIITLIKDWKTGPNKHFWLKTTLGFLIVSSILALSYLPNLLIAINFNPYRCGAGLTELCLISLIWALRTYCQYLPMSVRSSVMSLILSIVCFWGIYRCFDNIDRFRVKPSLLEYSFFKKNLDNFHGEIKEIYLIPLQSNDFYHNFDEFGVSTFNFDCYPNAVRLVNAMIVDMEVKKGKKWVGGEFYRNDFTYEYFFKDLTTGKKPFIYSVKLKIVVSDRPKVKYADSTLVINMNYLYDPLKQVMGQNYNFKVINKRSVP